MNINTSELIAARMHKQEAQRERTAEKKAAGIINKILIERQDDGLYTCRYSEAGAVPDELKGRFTQKQRVLEIIQRRNIPVEV